MFIMPAFAYDYKYILNDECINALYANAKITLYNQKEIQIDRDVRGINISFELPNPLEEINKPSQKTLNKLSKIQTFLAKIKNPVIIEVHLEKHSPEKSFKFKDWEISTVIANNIESEIRKSDKTFADRLHSVGYGEFLPKNTPNNGGKSSNRVDIIVLCKISGE